jgi:branched-chain amino acid transport system permease protein
VSVLYPTLVLERGINAGGLLRILGGSAILAILIFGMVALFGWLTGGRYETLLSSIGITAIIVVGYQIFVGNTGIISFGHPAFVALGAYAAGIVSIPVEAKEALLPDLPPLLASFSLNPAMSVLVGGLVSLAAALLVGPVVLRLSGAAASIMTFGLLVITNDLIRNATSLTKGTQTFFGVPRAVGSLAAFSCLAVFIVAATMFKFSRAGLRARAVSEDPLAAEISGVNVVRARLSAWAVSAFVTGIAGGLLAENLTAFSPASFYINLVIPMMLMAVLGGMTSVLGVVIGTAIISGWQELIRAAEASTLWPGHAVPVGLSDLTLGIGLIVILRLRPDGLFRNNEFGFLRSPQAVFRATSRR